MNTDTTKLLVDLKKEAALNERADLALQILYVELSPTHESWLELLTTLTGLLSVEATAWRDGGNHGFSTAEEAGYIAELAVLITRTAGVLTGLDQPNHPPLAVVKEAGHS